MDMHEQKELTHLRNAELGKRGEEITASFFKDLKYTILARNFKRFGGEIDLIVRSGNAISFVEVKSRLNLYENTEDLMFELVTPQKRKRMVHAAHHFISKYLDGDLMSYQFDVALVLFDKVSLAARVQWIPNAFPFDDDSL